ncbi:PAS domain-containing sensor histidine kinase [Nonlabens antarcticus]|uniref:PAS domain-containing sensor histidine kinase n=1 Tax=Nonlabens antarcticus TaxID=392714 RepID=UPI001891E5F8|nr:PAS domain-containing protein [Nonlabens antarcticus]
MVDDLKKSEFPYQEMMTHTCVICWVVDDNAKLLQANTEFFEAVGRQESFFDDHTIYDILAREDEWPECNDDEKKCVSKSSKTLKFFKENGQPVYLKCNIGVHGDRIYVAGINITEDVVAHTDSKTISAIAEIGGWSYIPSEGRMHYTEYFYNLLGIPKDRKIGKEAAMNFVHPDSRALMVESIKNIFESHLPFDIEIKLITTANKIIWVRSVATLEVYKGEVTFVQGISQNITKYKEQTIDLEETRANMQLALRAMNSGYFTHDLINDEIEYSDSFTDKMNFPNKLSQEEFINHLHPEDRKESQLQHNREIATSDVFYINAFRVQSQNDTFRHFEVHGFKVFDSNGDPIKLVANLIDVEDKYRLTKMQDKHRYHMKTLLENTFVRSILLDKEGVITGLDGNTRSLLQEKLGYNPILKKVLFKEILSDHDLLKFNIIERVLNQGQEYRKEVYLDLFDENRNCYEGLFKPILDYSNRIDGFVFYLFDLTDQVRMQEDLKSFQDKLKTVHHFKNNVLSQIEKDAQTPFHELIESTKNIFKKQSIADQEDQLIAAQIEGADQLMHAFDSMINNPSYEKNFYFIQEPIDLSLFLHNMRSGTMHRADLYNLDFSFKNFEMPTSITADPIFLKQAFENLLDYSFKVSKGSDLSISTYRKDNHAVINVKISGPQLVSTQLDAVFQSHEQDATKNTLVFQKLGLGIAFAMKYLEGIGGYIHVTKDSYKITNFIVALPLDKTFI